MIRSSEWVEKPELAKALIEHVESGYGEYTRGERLVHAKELTLCLIKANLDRKFGVEGEDNFLPSLPQQARVKIALGVAFGRLVNQDEEEVRALFAGGGDDRLITVIGHVDYPEHFDVIEVPGAVHIPGEIKVTWMYGDKISPQYTEQIAAYCVAKGISTGRLYIVKVTEKGGPIIHAYERTFTDKELDDWSLEMGRRAFLIVDEELPSMDDSSHYKWECPTCKYNARVIPGAQCMPSGGKEFGFFA